MTDHSFVDSGSRELSRSPAPCFTRFERNVGIGDGFVTRAAGALAMLAIGLLGCSVGEGGSVEDRNQVEVRRTEEGRGHPTPGSKALGPRWTEYRRESGPTYPTTAIPGPDGRTAVLYDDLRSLRAIDLADGRELARKTPPMPTNRAWAMLAEQSARFTDPPAGFGESMLRNSMAIDTTGRFFVEHFSRWGFDFTDQRLVDTHDWDIRDADPRAARWAVPRPWFRGQRARHVMQVPPLHRSNLAANVETYVERWGVDRPSKHHLYAEMPPSLRRSDRDPLFADFHFVLRDRVSGAVTAEDSFFTSFREHASERPGVIDPVARQAAFERRWRSSRRSQLPQDGWAIDVQRKHLVRALGGMAVVSALAAPDDILYRCGSGVRNVAASDGAVYTGHEGGVVRCFVDGSLTAEHRMTGVQGTPRFGEAEPGLAFATDSESGAISVIIDKTHALQIDAPSNLSFSMAFAAPDILLVERRRGDFVVCGPRYRSSPTRAHVLEGRRVRANQGYVGASTGDVARIYDVTTDPPITIAEAAAMPIPGAVPSWRSSDELVVTIEDVEVSPPPTFSPEIRPSTRPSLEECAVFRRGYRDLPPTDSSEPIEDTHIIAIRNGRCELVLRSSGVSVEVLCPEAFRIALSPEGRRLAVTTPEGVRFFRRG